MDGLFVEFRDPLFSVIVFFAIIFIISFVSYWWGRYKQKEDKKHLDRFLKQFRSLPSKDELKTLIATKEMSEKSWLLLANSYYKNGDYEKSIDIYNEILNIAEKKNVKEIMFLLAKTYFKAGFLERAKKIFLEILKNSPRTSEALHYLLLVYEYTKDYGSALEVLESLEELDEDIVLDSYYLSVLAILNNASLDVKQKSMELVEIHKKSSRLDYMIFEYLFRVDPEFAWMNFDPLKSKLLAEIFFKLPKEELNLDIISQNSFLKELYTARGDLSLVTSSADFELDILIKLGKKANATLSFEYICSSCKGVFPFAFHRCSICHSIDTAEVEWSLSRDYIKDIGEENNSFQ